jgi:hypothetical protein
MHVRIASDHIVHLGHRLLVGSVPYRVDRLLSQLHRRDHAELRKKKNMRSRGGEVIEMD